MPSILNRREFVAGAGALATAAVWAGGRSLQAAPAPLVAQSGTASLFGKGGPSTPIWGYGGAVPGPVLRVKQGARVAVPVSNKLSEPTSVHWHGLRPVNAMDGVPYLTQMPIAPGKSFTYELATQDAGTFWYHPHINSAEQVERGLAGALIVEEAKPIAVDRDVVWMLDDWQLRRDGTIAPGGGMHEAAHGGRLGNVPTINGAAGRPFRVRGGERIRLRLINAANARTFGLVFGKLNPWRVAVDGHPVTPKRLDGTPAVVPPGGRLDLIVDFSGKPGETFEIKDVYYRRNAYDLITVATTDESPLRTEDLGPPEALAANPVAAPDLANAQRHQMVFQGGAMGGLRQAEFRGRTLGLRELAGMGLIWAVDGRMIPPMKPGAPGEPMLDLKKGRSYIVNWRNDTAFDHPIHLHGHSFTLIARGGMSLAEPVVMDTVLIAPQESVEVAFVADNPGDWALHCHILEHAEAGMMGYLRVG